MHSSDAGDSDAGRSAQLRAPRPRFAWRSSPREERQGRGTQSAESLQPAWLTVTAVYNPRHFEFDLSPPATKVWRLSTMRYRPTEVRRSLARRQDFFEAF